MMKTDTPKNNPLICDPIEGVCSFADNTESTSIQVQYIVKPIKMIYFSDPLCSACWTVEPMLRRLKLEYGNSIEIEYHMGGLLPNWESMGGTVSPTSLASHSNVMSKHYEMPLNSEVWLQDPPQSSYPPSIAFKAAQLQDEDKAIDFIRRIREDLYVRSINIAKWDNIEKVALVVGLDVKKLKIDYETKAQESFEDDLRLAHEMNVRGFPSFYMINNSGASEMIYGAKPYHNFENALTKISKDIQKESYSKNWNDLFAIFHTMTTKEFAVLKDISFQEAELELNDLAKQEELTKFISPNGDLWIIN